MSDEIPIEVSSTPLPAQTGAGVRSILLILSALPAIVTILGQRDAMAIVRYLGSTEFAPIAALIAPIVILWGQKIARRLHKERAAMANRLPNSFARVK